jgi:hypothetical protein
MEIWLIPGDVSTDFVHPKMGRPKKAQDTATKKARKPSKKGGAAK